MTEEWEESQVTRFARAPNVKVMHLLWAFVLFNRLASLIASEPQKSILTCYSWVVRVWQSSCNHLIRNLVDISLEALNTVECKSWVLSTRRRKPLKFPFRYIKWSEVIQLLPLKVIKVWRERERHGTGESSDEHVFWSFAPEKTFEMEIKKFYQWENLLD